MINFNGIIKRMFLRNCEYEVNDYKGEYNGYKRNGCQL